MEKLMQYVWQHRLWPHDRRLTTSDGRAVSIIDQGRLNTDAGPDFFNAKVLIGGQMWAGDIEIHVKASDWMRHGHHNDPAYDSVILHVVGVDDTCVSRRDGRLIPQLCMPCDPGFRNHYDRLVNAPAMPCAGEIAGIGSLHMTSWLDALAFERIYAKEERILAYLGRLHGSWEEACYVALARALGFGLNSEPFERLAFSLPLAVTAKHSDSQLAVEAMLFGQAGLLPSDTSGTDPYPAMLVREYDFLARKFSLTPPTSMNWKMARTRPQNFPHRRIAYLAALMTGGFKMASRILGVEREDQLAQLFDVELSGYWSRHYTFGGQLTAASTHALSKQSTNVLAINVVVPLIKAYATATDNLQLGERAVEMLHDMRPESNSIVTSFTSCGVKCTDAFTSQALIQLRREYCEKRKCLYCRIGHRMLSRYSTLSQPSA